MLSTDKSYTPIPLPISWPLVIMISVLKGILWVILDLAQGSSWCYEAVLWIMSHIRTFSHPASAFDKKLYFGTPARGLCIPQVDEDPEIQIPSRAISGPPLEMGFAHQSSPEAHHIAKFSNSSKRYNSQTTPLDLPAESEARSVVGYHDFGDELRDSIVEPWSNNISQSMLSIESSESSGQTNSSAIVQDKSLLEITEPVIEQVWDAFLAFNTTKNNTNSEMVDVSEGTQEAGQGSRSEHVGTYQQPNSQNKTQRQGPNQPLQGGDDRDDHDGNDKDMPLPKSRRLPSTGSNDLLWACPFSKWKPIEYECCYQSILKDINRVKQHLNREHKLPPYCPTCNAKFPDEISRDQHLRARNCYPEQYLMPEGVTQRQHLPLSQRTSTKVSKEDHWYTIYEILFPQAPRPGSPYIDKSLWRPLSLLQDFFITEGSLMLENAVRENIPASLAPQQEEVITWTSVVFNRLIGRITETYVHHRQTQRSATQALTDILGTQSGSGSSLPTQNGVDRHNNMTSMTQVDTLLSGERDAGGAHMGAFNPNSFNGGLDTNREPASQPNLFPLDGFSFGDTVDPMDLGGLHGSVDDVFGRDWTGVEPETDIG